MYKQMLQDQHKQRQSSQKAESMNFELPYLILADIIVSHLKG